MLQTKPLLSLFLGCLIGLVGPISAMAGEEKADASTTTRTATLAEVREKYDADPSHFADIGGINVHYLDEGQGPVLLLVHGTLGDLHDWDTWAEMLKSDFRVIRLDLPGFGLTSEVPNGNFSVERSHTMIDAFMDHLGIEKFGVVGISYGGMVMFRYAATRVERITAMVLINSAGIQTGKGPRPEKKSPGEATKPVKNMFVDPVVTFDDVAFFYKNYINDESKRTPEFIQRKLDFLNIQGRDELAKTTLRFYEKGDPIATLAHVRAPSLIMWGTANKALDTETAQKFMDALTNACTKKLVTFDKGGHYINVERPEATAKVAKEFLMGLKDNFAGRCANSCQ
ncbi:alpha/beta hydrolase [Halioxenophilus sp. WMMB6]|uniref:alpha/beta fold hydrolase n=1 Tax=Halioxenophilus sp. WMMB6 TaxID=3073815 RepID=UPI00295F176A|nr:alpha/beta hydrolase [Halioxenophilus sp. WMMB6]